MSYEGARLTLRGFLVAVIIAALLVLGAGVWLVLAGPWRP
jgi:hypothetical protein